MCWGKEFWFYCHSDHWYHYPAHSYYLWENGGQVVRLLTWNLESWKKIDLSPGKFLEKVFEICFWKRVWTLTFMGKAVSQSLSLHSPSGIGYKLASSKTWWNAEEGGGVTYGGQTSCPGGWEGAILLVASCCRNWEKLWLLCELMLYV